MTLGFRDIILQYTVFERMASVFVRVHLRSVKDFSDDMITFRSWKLIKRYIKKRHEEFWLYNTW
jgi:hypothetical protein